MEKRSGERDVDRMHGLGTELEEDEEGTVKQNWTETSGTLPIPMRHRERQNKT